MTQSESDSVRTELGKAVAILRPYSQSSGAFHSKADVLEAIKLAQHALERAERLLAKS